MSINDKDWVTGRTSVYVIGYHFVWSTKCRRTVIIDKVEGQLKKILKDVAKEKGFIIETMEMMPDHCHVFVRAHPKFAPSLIAKLLKGISARKLFQEFPALKKQLWKGHLWNPSYYVGTVGNMSKEVVKRYIAEQKLK